MRILIASPLYPPDIAEPAPYSKELARRLGQNHVVTVVTYGDLPEQIPGVTIIHTNKKRPLAIRLMLYTALLLRESLRSDVLYAVNGASVELPAVITSILTGKRLYAHIGDTGAHMRAQKHLLLRYIEQSFFARTESIVEHRPQPRPEMLPFSPSPIKEMEVFERSWEEHVAVLETTFKS